MTRTMTNPMNEIFRFCMENRFLMYPFVLCYLFVGYMFAQKLFSNYPDKELLFFFRMLWIFSFWLSPVEGKGTVGRSVCNQNTQSALKFDKLFSDTFVWLRRWIVISGRVIIQNRPFRQGQMGTVFPYGHMGTPTEYNCSHMTILEQKSKWWLFP